MTGAVRNNNMLTNKLSHESGDIEAMSSSGQISEIQNSISTIEPYTGKIIDEENNDGRFVDIDKWADNLARILEDIPQYMCNPGHPGRISRIPENICEVDTKAYEPYFLSIGPYHRGKPRLEQMEKTKLVFLKCFLQQKPEHTLKEYLMKIKSIEQEARSFYLDIEMNSEKFVRMLLLDGLYIVTAFCGMESSQETPDQSNMRTQIREDNVDAIEGVNQITEEHNVDAIEGVNQITEERSVESRNGEEYMPGWFFPLFVHDIFLLENQLPFFVLQMIHVLVNGAPETELIDIIKDKFRMLLSRYTTICSEVMISPPEKVHHLLHLCHMFFRPKHQHDSIVQPHSESNQMFRLGSAAQLYEAGVSFKARSDSTEHCLLDVMFECSGKMVMPCLQVDDNTVSLLRNLIALEQMKYPRLGLNVSAYAVLLLHLVTTPEDVKLLRRKGIIQHHLASDEEMMYLVNRLSVGLAFDYVEDDYSLKHVFNAMKNYSERRVPGWKAWLKHKYFGNPWTAISLFAASLLLFLTALQTYYTVYSYYRPYMNLHL